MQPQSYYRCWVEVDLAAIRRNVAALRHRIGPARKLLAVVKADAYGHGLTQVAGALMQTDIHGFAVATLAEALTVRQLGGAGWPILLFGAALPFELDKLVEQSIIPTIGSVAAARELDQVAAAHNRRVAVHVEIDTGMGRMGLWHEDAPAQLHEIQTLPHLRVTGLYTHFPSADENLDVTRQELATFTRLAEPPLLRHAANSAALLNLPESHLDAVRPGLLLYGILPALCGDNAAAASHDFTPALTFKSRVAFVKDVSAGRSISYGQTFVAPRPMRIATIACGYADGFSRHLSNSAEVLVGGARCPVVGRVTMDQVMVDVSRVADVRSGMEVVLLGRQDPEEITATEMAGWAGTIAWEVLCGITKSARVPRLYRGTAAA